MSWEPIVEAVPGRAPGPGRAPCPHARPGARTRGPVSVHALYAVAELVPDDGSRASPGSTSYDVCEHAVLSDGRHVTLLADRGWSESGLDLPVTAEEVRRGVANASLPDDAEHTGEAHEWGLFAERLREAGVDVPVEQLRRLPYDVRPGPRLAERLRS